MFGQINAQNSVKVFVVLLIPSVVHDCIIADDREIVAVSIVYTSMISIYIVESIYIIYIYIYIYFPSIHFKLQSYNPTNYLNLIERVEEWARSIGTNIWNLAEDVAGSKELRKAS